MPKIDLPAQNLNTKHNRMWKRWKVEWVMPVEDAMATYAYSECFKSKKPSFGGRKNCADAMIQKNLSAQIAFENGSKVGKDFQEFKCKFCCSTVQRFCWENTDFCEPCRHDRNHLDNHRSCGRNQALIHGGYWLHSSM